MMIWIFPRLSLFFSRKEIFHLTSRCAFLGCQNLKNSRKTTISTASRPKQALLLVSLLLVLFAVVRDRE